MHAAEAVSSPLSIISPGDVGGDGGVTDRAGPEIAATLPVSGLCGVEPLRYGFCAVARRSGSTHWWSASSVLPHPLWWIRPRSFPRHSTNPQRKVLSPPRAQRW